jgi:hypothetical protein
MGSLSRSAPPRGGSYDGDEGRGSEAGMAITYGGMTCTAYSGHTTNANPVCVRNNLKGYGVVIRQP